MWGMRRVPSRVGPVDTTREGAHHTSPAADFPVEPLNDAVPPSRSGAPGTGQAERAGRERGTGGGRAARRPPFRLGCFLVQLYNLLRRGLQSLFSENRSARSFGRA